jgi:hypothetical protein
MVERHPIGGIDKEPQGPAPGRPRDDLLQATRHVACGHQDHPRDAPRKGTAVVVHPPVVGAIHHRFYLRVFTQRPGPEPARGQRQIDIHAFEVHVLDAGRRIRIDERRRILALMRSGKASHIAWTGRRGLGVGQSQAAAIGARPAGVGDMACAALHGLIRFPGRQPGLFLRR